MNASQAPSTDAATAAEASGVVEHVPEHRRVMAAATRRRYDAMQSGQTGQLPVDDAPARAPSCARAFEVAGDHRRPSTTLTAFAVSTMPTFCRCASAG